MESVRVPTVFSPHDRKGVSPALDTGESIHKNPTLNINHLLKLCPVTSWRDGNKHLFTPDRTSMMSKEWLYPSLAWLTQWCYLQEVGDSKATASLRNTPLCGSKLTIAASWDP